MGASNTISSIKGKRKKLLDVLLNAENEGVLEVCDKAGIAVSTYYKYIKDENFRKMINDNCVISCTVKKPKILRALNKQAEKGNIPAIRTFLEFDGSIGKGTTQTVNVGVTNKDAQAETVYANDDEALEAISRDIATLQAFRQAIMERQAEARNSRLKGDGMHQRDGDEELDKP